MGEELDDELVVVQPACPTRKVVVLQPKFCFVVILDDVAWLMEVLWETCVIDVVSESL
jgi:hypothetical protein